MPTSKREKKKSEEDSDSDDEAEQTENEAEDAEPKTEFKLGHTVKLAGFMFLTFILLSSDVFITRVLGRSGVDLVSGQYPTKKGIAVQAVLLAMSTIIFEFLICKEKL
jgi:hypothetical protein